MHIKKPGESPGFFYFSNLKLITLQLLSRILETIYIAGIDFVILAIPILTTSKIVSKLSG